MKRIVVLKLLAGGLSLISVFHQTSTRAQQPQEPKLEDILRITAKLVQTDVVVVDKNEQPVTGLKLEDFEVYENGKRQEIKFMEFVSVDAGRRAENNLPGREQAVVPRDLTAQQLKRVVAFVIDDVTIPVADMIRVRELLTDFVDNKMHDGDLVAIVRTVGGKGLHEQFTTDRQILRRAIALLTPRSISPIFSTTESDPGRVTKIPSPGGSPDLSETVGNVTLDEGLFPDGPTDGVNQISRALLSVAVSNFVIDGMHQMPGRKNLVLISGGIPLSAISPSGSTTGGDTMQLFRRLMDNAVRSGVAINTLDIRGLSPLVGVASFADTPAKSALGGGSIAGPDETGGFGRTADTARLGDRALDDRLGLAGLASATGGVSVFNSNNFREGLDKVLSRSRSYYRLAFTPSENFDNKFRKIDIKVRRSGVKTYAPEGYYAREAREPDALTKEERIVAVAHSPLAKRDLDVTAQLQYKFVPETNQADLDVNVLLGAEKLKFEPTTDGKRRASFDVVGFVFDQTGRSRGGFSETVNAELTHEGYARALRAGIGYTASTRLSPGYYQMRVVVREEATDRIGSASRYFEVPDLANKRLTASSLRLYAIDPSAKAADAVETLTAAPLLSRNRDLRYALVIYNAKLEGGRPQVRTQLMISQNGKLLFQEPEQVLDTKGGTATQLVRIGQLGLSKVAPGRYLITIVVTDQLADKKHQRIIRRAEFTVE